MATKETKVNRSSKVEVPAQKETATPAEQELKAIARERLPIPAKKDFDLIG